MFVHSGIKSISQNQGLLWKLLRVTQILINRLFFGKKLVRACEKFSKISSVRCPLIGFEESYGQLNILWYYVTGFIKEKGFGLRTNLFHICRLHIFLKIFKFLKFSFTDANSVEKSMTNCYRFSIKPVL